MAFATGRPMAMSTMTAADTTSGTYSRHDSTLLLESNMRNEEEADTEGDAASSTVLSSTGTVITIIVVVVFLVLPCVATEGLVDVDGIHAFANLIEASKDDRHIQNDSLRLWTGIGMRAMILFVGCWMLDCYR
jgi:hypothetical protein